MHSHHGLTLINVLLVNLQQLGQLLLTPQMSNCLCQYCNIYNKTLVVVVDSGYISNTFNLSYHNQLPTGKSKAKYQGIVKKIAVSDHCLGTLCVLL